MNESFSIFFLSGAESDVALCIKMRRAEQLSFINLLHMKRRKPI
jgi:hypothetical protein